MQGSSFFPLWQEILLEYKTKIKKDYLIYLLTLLIAIPRLFGLSFWFIILSQ